MERFPLPGALLGLALGAAATPQSPILLQDVNAVPKPNPSSFPTGHSPNYWAPWDNNRFAKTGPFALFRATDGTQGYELYRSPPSPNTASLIKDIKPGAASGNLYAPVAIGGKAYFQAYTAAGGSNCSIWETDGTPAGTKVMSS